MLGKVENGLREAATMLRKRLYRIVGHPDSGSTTHVPTGGDIDIVIDPGDTSLADARVTMSHSQVRRLILMAELGIAAFDAETRRRVTDCQEHRELVYHCSNGEAYLSGRCERGRIYLRAGLPDSDERKEFHGEAADWQVVCREVLAEIEHW